VSQVASFTATLLQSGKTATGIEVPADVLEGLNTGKRPPVRVRVNGYEYRTTVGSMDGKPMLSVSAEHREAAGLSAGDTVTVEIEVDAAPRTVDVPEDFAAALAAYPAAAAFFATLSNSNKKWHVLQVTGAKTDETRQRRIVKSVQMLSEGRAR
jgi:hypothetical protein